MTLFSLSGDKMTKKAFLTIIAVCILTVTAVCCVACSTPENTVKIENGIISRFGDGISVINSYSSPEEAVEYTDTDRVKARINIDARVGGYHVTGIYLPAGETLTVNVSNDISQLGYGLNINSMTEDRKYVHIDIAEKKITSEKGGIVEIYVPTSGVRQNSFDVILEGGIVMPYYRMGRDSIDNLYEGQGKYAILDGENIRFYVPTDMLFDSEGDLVTDDIYNTLMWWQSAVTFMNKATEQNGMDYNYAVRVSVGDYGKAPAYSAVTKAIQIDRSYFENALNFENLKSGSAWELLYRISELKVSSSSGFDGVFGIEMITDILCSVDYVMMTNSSYNAQVPTSWLNNSYTCLQKTKELIALPESARDDNYDRDVLRAFFINIMHSYGVDKIMDIIIEYSHASKNNADGENQGEMTFDDLALIMSDVLGLDMSFYFDSFDMQLSQEVKNKMKDKKLYIPVQSKYTVGGSQDVYDIGYTVPMGEKTEFDFNDSIISLIDGWKVAKINGESNLWSNADGKFYYSPSTKKLEDSYELLLRNGEYSTTLYGRINVDIATATYKVYEGWTFSNMATALEDAIDKYDSRTPDYSGSIDFAGVKKYEEEDDNTYVLTVTEGCMSVPESGDYTIYLKNTGLCQVEFGVQKYMFEMFTNSLPVADYTDYLSYDIHLDNDKIYEFKIYMLSTKGEGSAVLGIKHKDGDDDTIYDIDDKYLIYRGLSRNDIVEYQPPQIYPEGYGYIDEFCKEYDIDEKNFLTYPEAVVTSGLHQAFDSLSTSYYVAYENKNEYEFVIDLSGSKRTEYISFIARSGMQGAKVRILTAQKNEDKKYGNVKLLEDYTIQKGLNLIEYDPSTAKFVKIVFYGEENFECAFTDFEIGQVFEKSQIVANTSSSLAYMGGWSDMQGYVSVNGSISQSVDNNSIMSFTAICRQVCFYGVKDSVYGKMDVYVDGSLYTTVDLYSPTPVTDTLLFAIDFDSWREHSIKVMPAGKEDMINVDYISYIPVEEEELAKNVQSFYYVLIIPAVIALALLGAWIADRVHKNKSHKIK